MSAKYAYSLDRELYTGAFDTREAAVKEAMEKAQTDPSSPGTVYVGQMVALDPRSTGHAKSILNSISRRFRSELGEAAEDMLASVTKEQVKDLDEAISQAIKSWFQKNDLQKSFSRIEAISEHPVPTARQVPENQEIGVVDSLGDNNN